MRPPLFTMVLVLCMSPILSGCTDSARLDSTEEDHVKRQGADSAAQPTPSPLAPEQAKSDPEPVHRGQWNFTLEFEGDTAAISFTLNETTRVYIHEILHYASYGARDTRQTAGGLLLYEPSGGVSFLHSTVFGAFPLPDYYYSVETPVGRLEGEDYYQFTDSYRFGENEFNVSMPAGEWTLISYHPGALATKHDIAIRFDRPVEVLGPVWGALGFNFDERAFAGGAAATTVMGGVIYDRQCKIDVDHLLIAHIALTSGVYRGMITGPDGDSREFISLGATETWFVPDLTKMPIYESYGPGAWTFKLEAGLGAGFFATNLMGADLPLPTKGFSGPYDDDEALTGCA